MPRCELSGKGPVVKNLVSHSNIKTKSIAQPNIQKKSMLSRSLNAMVSFRVATSTIRTMENKGGFDAYILKQPDDILSKRALQVKKKISRKLGQTKPAVQPASSTSKKKNEVSQ